MHKTLIVLLLACITLTGFSTGASAILPVKVLQLKNDSAKVAVRNFDLQKINAYRAQREFIYDHVAPANESLWDRFWKWFWSLIDNVLSNKYSGGVIKYVVIAVFVALLVFAVVKLTGADLKIFAGKSKAVEIPYSESLDNIHEINFSEEIDKAIAGSNYRLAVRLFYLYSLKLLNEQALINWQPEKTNQTYVREIADPGKKQQFSLLTMQFEYIWYGEFFIDKESFGLVKERFDNFNQGSI
jgi:hypothetical protein